MGGREGSDADASCRLEETENGHRVLLHLARGLGRAAQDAAGESHPVSRRTGQRQRESHQGRQAHVRRLGPAAGVRGGAAVSRHDGRGLELRRRGRAFTHREDLPQRDARRGHPVALRDHDPRPEGGRAAACLPRFPEQERDGLHVFALQDACSGEPRFSRHLHAAAPQEGHGPGAGRGQALRSSDAARCADARPDPADDRSRHDRAGLLHALTDAGKGLGDRAEAGKRRGERRAVQLGVQRGGRMTYGRRQFLRSSGAVLGVTALGGCAPLVQAGPADVLIVNGRVATLNPRQPEAAAIAIKGDTIVGVGSEAELNTFRDEKTRVIDAGRRTVIPGLNDAHTHFIRGGLTYTNEVRWDGVPSLAEGLRRVREQAQRTPAPHWVQVIGGWTWAQFAEQRYPTLEEINAATGDTPCMIMHLYDRAWLNRAGIRALGWTKDTPNMFGGAIERDASGNPTGLVMSTTSLASLVSVWLRIPRLSPEDQILSTRHFMREHNRLGVTSVIDAGGGGQNYPDNYAAIAKLAADGQMTLRIGYTLFAQAPGKELENYTAWAKLVKFGQGNDYYRMIGTGEYILYAAGDVANFAKDYPIPPAGVMEKNLSAVVKFIVGQGWPFRQHTTFDASASRVLDVLEQVNREIPLKNLRWGLDHCEALKPATLERLAALGGSIDIQNRMSLDGEAFLKKYGAQAAADAPPVARIREMGIPLACGTDGNRATSYNPWIGLHWLVTGKTLGGAKLQGERNLLDRTEALRLYTTGGAWVSGEEDKKGTLEPGKFADLAILSADYFKVPEDRIKDIESLLTMVGGKVVYGAGPYSRLSPPLPPVSQEWLPVREYGEYYRRTLGEAQNLARAFAQPGIIGDAGVWGACGCGVF